MQSGTFLVNTKILRTDRKRFVSIQNFDLKTFTFDLLYFILCIYSYITVCHMHYILYILSNSLVKCM
jgi:hypothetical protein